MATTIATSTFAQPVARAGSRSLIKLGSGNLLVVYHNGANGFRSKEASSEANLASATAVSIASTTDSNDPRSYCLWPDGIFLSAIGSVSAATNYQTYSAGAWTAHAAPPVWGNFDTASGFKSGTSYYFSSWGNFNAEFDAHYATSFGGTFSGLGQNNTANSDGMDNQGLVALPWNGKILNLLLDSGKNLQWYAGDTLSGTNGGNFNAATSIEIITGPYQNNLAGVTDSNGNAWMAYNDGGGIKLRMLTASGSSWTAKTTVTSAAADAYPALFQDTAGGVYVIWIDGGTGNNIKAQKATVAAGAISLSGSVITIIGTSATRNYLTSIESDASNIYLTYVEGTASPYNIVVHAYSLSTTTTNSRTITPVSAALQSTLSRTISSNTGAIGNYVIRTITSVQAALQATNTRTIGTVTANILPNINPVVVATADMQSQTRMGRPIVRDGSGIAVIPITPTWSDATQFGPAAFIYSSPSPYSTWTQRNSPGSGLTGLRLGEEDTGGKGVSNPSLYFDSVNNDIFGFGQNNQNDGLSTHAYNDITFAYATAYNGTFTTTNYDTTQWENIAFTSVVMVPGTHNLWFVNCVLPPGTTYGSSAAHQTLAFRATTGETTSNWVGNGAVGSASTSEGPFAAAAASVYLFPQMAYTAGSPATLYCFFNDSQGVLRYCTWSDAATPVLPTGLNVSSTSFSSPISSGSLGVTNEQFSVARDSSDGLHVVVKNGSGIQYTYKPLGGSWTAAATISSAANDVYPRVTCFGNTRAVVTWVQATGTANKQNIVYAYTAISSAPSFGSAITIFNDSGTNNASYVNTEANSQDTTSFLVTWVQGTASPYSVYAAQVTPSFVTTSSRTITSASAALQSTLARTMAPATVRLSGTFSRTINSATASVARLRTISPASVALQATLARTMTPASAALQATLARTMTPVTAALQGSPNRTMTPVTTALQGSPNRTMPATVTLQGSPNRTMPATVTLTSTINLFSPNQSDIEVDTTGLSPVSAGVTISRDTSTAWHGAASLKVVTDGTVASQGFRAVVDRTTFIPGGTYTVSVYLWGSGTVRLIFLAGTPIFGVIGSPQNITLTGTNTRYSVTGTLPNPLTALQYGIQVDTAPGGNQAITFNADGLQIETGSTLTDWTPGSVADRSIPASAALQSIGLARTVTPATGALQSLGLTRTLTPATTALLSTLSRTLTPASVALQGLGVARTMTPATAALQSTLSRTLTGNTVRLLSTLGRTMTPATAVFSGTFSRTMASNSANISTAGTFSRSITSATVRLSGTVARTMTPATGALQSLGLARTMTPAIVALQSTLPRTMTPATVALLGTLPRTMSAVVVLSGTFPRTISGVTASLQGTGVTRTMAPVTVALQSPGLTRTMTPAIVALQSTLGRTMTPASVALQSTLSRTLAPATVALQGSGITRTMTPVTAALQSLGLARTMVPVTATIATLAQSRTIPSVSSALQSTLFRSCAPITVAVQATLQRALTPATVSLAGSPVRNIPSTVALSGTSQRVMSVEVALSGGSARAINAAVWLSGTSSRTLAGNSAAVQSTLARSVANTAAIQSLNVARTIAGITATVAFSVAPAIVANETAVFTVPTQTASMIVPSQTAVFRIVG